MRQFYRTLFTGIMALLLFTGCASSNYLTDRANDAADMVTCTAGSNSFGFGVRMGPVAVGVYLGMENERIGLRGGEWLNESLVETFPLDFFKRIMLIALIIYGESFYTDSEENSGKDKKDYRNKSFVVEPLYGWMPIAISEEEGEGYAPAYYFTQFEFVLGLVGGVRLGINPGEILDFFLGWTTIDIYGDDVGIIPEENKKAAKKPTPK